MKLPIFSLMIAAAAGSARAQVSDVSFSFRGDLAVTRIYDGLGDPNDDSSYTVIGDESFLIEGGTELLPFDMTAIGGDFSEPGRPFLGRDASVEIEMSGSLSAGGELALLSSQRSRVGFDGYFPASTATFSVDVFFSVDRTSDFTFSGSAGGSVDFGGADGALFDADDNLIFAWGSFGPPTGDVAGVLESGSYRLSTTGSIGSLAYDFNVAPSPGPAALFVLAAGVVARRRR